MTRSKPGVRFGLRFLVAVSGATVVAVLVAAAASVPGLFPGATGIGLAFGGLLLVQSAYGRVRRARVVARRREF